MKLSSLDVHAEVWEGRFGRLPVAVGVGVVLAFSAALYIVPEWSPTLHGAEFAALSRDPFDLTTPSRFRYRILSPLLGWITGARGDRFILVPWFFLWAFIAAVYHEFRNGQPPGIALLAAVTMAFSCTTFIPLVAPGYTDPATFLFVWLTFSQVAKPTRSALSFALAITNHEATVFLLPAVLYHHHLHGTSVLNALRAFLASLLILLPYVAYRIWVGAQHVGALGVDHYFSAENIRISLREITPTALWGAFLTFRLFWLVPAFAFIKLLQARQYAKATFHPIAFFCVAGQLIIAYDTTRMFCLAFPLILVGLLQLAALYGKSTIVGAVLALFALNLLIPPAMVGSNQVFPLRDRSPVPVATFTRVPEAVACAQPCQGVSPMASNHRCRSVRETVPL